MTLPEHLDVGMYYKNDDGRVVKLTSVSDDKVDFDWMGITFFMDKEKFCKEFSFVSVPGMK